MFINIQNLFINKPCTTNVVKDYQSIIGIVFSSFISIVVMFISNKWNERRWLNGSYIRRKAELEIDIRKRLLNIKKKFDMFPDIEVLHNICNKNDSNYLKEMTKINSLFWEIKKDLKEYDKKDNNLYICKGLKDEFNVEKLINEYIIFINLNRCIFTEFIDFYNQFYNTNEIVIMENQLVQKEFTERIFDNNIKEIKILLNIIINIKELIIKIIESIEKNFRTTW